MKCRVEDLIGRQGVVHVSIYDFQISVLAYLVTNAKCHTSPKEVLYIYNIQRTTP